MTEFEVQDAMVQWFKDEGLTSHDPPNVSAQENAGNPHYNPTPDQHRPIRRDELVLIDLWGKLPVPGAVFADIAWVGFTGEQVPVTFATRVLPRPPAGRDAAIELVESAIRNGRELRGYEVDRVCRAVLERAGFGAEFIHRTGHSLGQHVHGDGVHMDDYETHDDRRLIPGHRLYNRTGRLYRSVRCPDRDQHVRVRTRRESHGPAAAGDRFLVVAGAARPAARPSDPASS